jgi:hypothetical protein
MSKQLKLSLCGETVLKEDANTDNLVPLNCDKEDTQTLSPLLQSHMKDAVVQAFIEQLSDIEKIALDVAIDILPMMNLKKCNGFQTWKKTEAGETAIALASASTNLHN